VVYATTSAPASSAEVEAMLLQKFQEIAAQCKNAKSSSTATIAHVSADNHLTVVHLGDSPLYLFARNDEGMMTPHLLIQPHNITNRQEVNRLLGAKVGTDGFRKTGSSTRGFGGSDIDGFSSAPEVTHVDLNSYFNHNEKIYLCASSDGLYEGDRTKAEDFASIISQAEAQDRLRDVPQLLTSYAYGNRNPDNLSVVFAEIPRAA
jgi:serine/threonine protein phosphatase PrpC